jgi:hypothetical protein
LFSDKGGQFFFRKGGEWKIMRTLEKGALTFIEYGEEESSAAADEAVCCLILVDQRRQFPGAIAKRGGIRQGFEVEGILHGASGA